MQTQYAFRIVSHQEPPTDSTGIPDLTQNDQASCSYATTCSLAVLRDYALSFVAYISKVSPLSTLIENVNYRHARRLSLCITESEKSIRIRKTSQTATG